MSADRESPDAPAEEADDAPRNRAERRARGKGRGGAQPTGRGKVAGRSSAVQSPRMWTNRRGGG